MPSVTVKFSCTCQPTMCKCATLPTLTCLVSPCTRTYQWLWSCSCTLCNAYCFSTASINCDTLKMTSALKENCLEFCWLGLSLVTWRRRYSYTQMGRSGSTWRFCWWHEASQWRWSLESNRCIRVIWINHSYCYRPVLDPLIHSIWYWLYPSQVTFSLIT